MTTLPILKAADVAARWHAGRRRKGATVAALTADHDGNIEFAHGALPCSVCCHPNGRRSSSGESG